MPSSERAPKADWKGEVANSGDLWEVSMNRMLIVALL